MAKRPHLYFRGEQLHGGNFNYPRRNVNSGDDEEPIQKDYMPMQEDFRVSLGNFNRKRRQRAERRNPQIDVRHLDFIQFNFFNVFKIADFRRKYLQRFGLTPVSFWDYNRSGLFAIEDRDRFEQFITDIQNFIEAENPRESDEYSPIIRFIKSFNGFSTEEILKISETHPRVTVDLIKTSGLFADYIEPIQRRLVKYLQEQNVDFELNTRSETIELVNPIMETLIEIADNFDILQSVSSHDSGIIRPSRYGIPIREYGFSINEDDIEGLPIIGILDSGVSDQNPLAPLLIEANPSFDLTNTDPFDDQIDHGTGVAGLAALGIKPFPDFLGEFEADARILPIKIISRNRTTISQKGVIDAIRRAYEEYGVRIFVLTVTWDEPKKTHEKQSEYTFSLDQLANELNILIFISTGNLQSLYRRRGATLLDYPDHFLDEVTNLQTPADSMNNITVGAVADDLLEQNFDGFSIDESYPAVYSRKSHFDWNDGSLKKTLVNLQLVKPDILMPGGDYDRQTEPDVYGIQVLSSVPGRFFDKQPGTSYSAPLAANIAARLLKQYPSISNMQTIKAILINSAEVGNLGPEFVNIPKRTKIAIHGHGKPTDDVALFSDNHRATFIIESSIRPETMEMFELQLPDYLQHMYKSRALLKVNATLCFKFDPAPDNHIAYCPIHFAFGFFKNLPINQITTGKLDDIKLKEGWTEDYYFGDKVLSNTQKVSFSISKPDLVNENNVVRIGIHNRLHKHLDTDQTRRNNRLHQYSLVVSVEENTREDRREHNLYDELVAINELEAIAEIELDAEV